MKTFTAVGVVAALIIAGGAWYWLGHNSTSPTAPTNTVSYSCNGGASITAAYYEGEKQPAPAPGEPPTPSGSVALALSDGRAMTLLRTLSADGLRYANADESFVFWSKGDSVLVLENGKEKSYIGCVVNS